MKESSFEIYVEKFNYIKTNEDIEINFLPPLLRRRLSALDKCVVSVLQKSLSDDVQNIVFSSQFGEADRLNKIISQYTEAGEVSPNTFAGSVHNYPVGFFLLNAQKPLPYTAISSATQSISAGLLTAITSKLDKTIFCYADVSTSFAFCINKKPADKSVKYKITLNPNNENNDDFVKYVEIFTGKTASLQTSFFKIERATDVE